MKKIWGWNLKPPKRSEKWQILEKKLQNFEQPKDTIQSFNSSTCHPRWATCAHEHPTKPLVYATHCKWNTCKSILLSQLQCVSPTVSDTHVRAYHHDDSSTCHPRQVACAHEHPNKPPVRVTHGEWYTWKSITLCLQYRSPTTSDIYARAYY